MYKKHQTRQCLICHKPLNQEASLFHLLQNPPVCLNCLNGLNVLDRVVTVSNYKVHVLYEYNDFFRKLLFQYKALDDYALKEVFLLLFPELKKSLKKQTIVIIPSSEKDNLRRGFCPNEEIAKLFSPNIFKGLYKSKEYKQTKQVDRSGIKKVLTIKEGYLLHNKDIIIFDDVMTSSNTIQAAIKQIEKYHPKSIRIIVLACPHINNFIT